jgi:hypothetical protein
MFRGLASATDMTRTGCSLPVFRLITGGPASGLGRPRSQQEPRLLAPHAVLRERRTARLVGARSAKLSTVFRCNAFPALAVIAGWCCRMGTRDETW